MNSTDLDAKDEDRQMPLSFAEAIGSVVNNHDDAARSPGCSASAPPIRSGAVA